MILTVLTSAFQVFCFSVWACLMFFSRLKRGDAPWKRWPQRWTLVLIVSYGCVLGGPCSQHDLHWSEVFLHLLAEAVFARLLYCKVKTSFFFFFFVLNPCMFWVADIWHSFWLSHSLNSFPIIRNFLPWEFLLGRGSRLKCVSTLLEVRVRNSCGRSQRHSVSRQWGRCHVDPTSEETAEI